MCQAQACDQMRNLIREKLADGWTKDQIKQYFVDQYGDRVLMVPPAKGLNWFLYLIPAAILIGAVYFVVHFVKQSPKQNDIDFSTDGTTDSTLKEQLERDLREGK
jgi:cytochrome c-type biogenesis protein CcmH